MEIILHAILDTILGGIGRLVRKLLGQPVSETGTSEMLISVAVVAVVLVPLFAFT
jgi:hypothetical protein